jgi:hypothetical protein
MKPIIADSRAPGYFHRPASLCTFCRGCVFSLPLITFVSRTKRCRKGKSKRHLQAPGRCDSIDLAAMIHTASHLSSGRMRASNLGDDGAQSKRLIAAAEPRQYRPAESNPSHCSTMREDSRSHVLPASAESGAQCSAVCWPFELFQVSRCTNLSASLERN